MLATRNTLFSLAAVLSLGSLAAACDGGMGLGSPLTATKEVFVGKPVPTPALADRPNLVIPPPNAALPVPGQPSQTASINNQWQASTAEPQKQAADTAVKKDQPGWFSGMFGSDTAKKTQ